MKVWVIMGNDFPDSVFDSEAKAKACIAQKKEETAERRKAGWSQIYWRSYEYEVQ